MGGGGGVTGWVRGQAAWQGESNCVERAECSGPAVRSSFISGLYVRYNLPGCQASTSISQPSPPPLPPPHSITNCHHPSLLCPPLPSLILPLSLWWLCTGVRLCVLSFFWLKPLNAAPHVQHSGF